MMTVDTNPLLVDDRDGSKELMRYEPVASTGTLARLTSGDVAFAGNGPDGPVWVGVEVKSIYDLISSMNTGRLQATQIPAMLAEFSVSWLLYFGAYRQGLGGRLEIEDRNGRWRTHRIGGRDVPYGYLQSFLFDLTMAGIHVQRVIDIREAVTWVGCIHRWWSKPWDKHKGFRTFDKSGQISLMPHMSDHQRAIACVAKELPGVGFERALAAASYFGSISEMINAPAEEWARVPGVGKVIAGTVHKFVRFRG